MVTKLGPDQANKQDFLQIFQGGGIRKVKDNLRSADDLLSYTANGSQVDLVSLVSASCVAKTHPTVSCRAPDQLTLDRWTGQQFIILSSKDNRRRGDQDQDIRESEIPTHTNLYKLTQNYLTQTYNKFGMKE